MNLALHGFLLQVLLSILNLQHGSLLCSAGEPGYLDFDNLPETNFSCQGKVIGGYYADVEAGCQMFHVCTIGQKDEIMDIKFLCLNGTVFDQETRVCERVDEVDCSKSERFYNLNLELYGNNAVTLSLHENSEDDIESSNPGNDHQRTTSARPTSSTTTSTTTSNPNKPSSTPSPTPFSHSTGYPQHFQPQPVFPPVHTSQSKSLYDDKNGRYHHQYIFHTGERSNNQQATSYQLFSNQGVSSTTAQPPQVHQIRFSSTASPQIIRNEPSTVAPLFHATSSTIQTLLNSNGNSPALINPIFHSHGIASTTEQFSIHSNNPRETSDYHESGEQGIRPLEAIQSTNKGKVSKLTISPVPTPEPQRSVQTKISSQSSEQRISGNFLPTPAADETTVRSFYPTPRISAKPGQGSQSNTEQVTQHIHVLPPVPIPQLKPHQITINLPPPDLQRIVQNPSSLLPSQSRVIVTAKASVSDESGRPLNTTQLVTLPLPTIPASYDDYKEGDESFDPFYRDVPKIRNHRHVAREKTVKRFKRSVGQTMNSMVSFMYGGDSTKRKDAQLENLNEKDNKDKISLENGRQDFKTIKESLIRFRDILFGGEFTEDTIRNVFEGSRLQEATSGEKVKTRKKDSLEDLETKASKNFKAREYDEDSGDEEVNEKDDVDSIDVSPHGVETPLNVDTMESDAEEYIDIAEKQDIKLESEESEESLDMEHNEEIETDKEENDDEEDISTVEHESEESKLDSMPREPQRVIDVVILDPEEYSRLKSSGQDGLSSTTEKEETTTEISTVSSAAETTQKTIDNYFAAQNKSSTFEELTENVEENSQPQKVENEQQTIVEEEKPKEQKPGPRRKSARIRSSRGKISARKKEMKIVNDEIVKIPEEKVSIENIETTTVKVNSEAEIIDKHIFDEPESQTSKEVDTRAVNNHSAYPKSLQTGKGQDLGKGNQKGEANEYESLQKQSKNLEDEIKHIDRIVKNEEKATVRTPYDNESDEEVKIEEEEYDDKLDEPEKLKENISIEEKSYYKEVSSIEHKEVEHESTTTFDKENSREEDDSDSEFTKNPRRNKSMKFEDSNYSKEISSSHKQDKTENIKDDDEDDEVMFKEKEESREVQEYSTIKGEEINSDEMSEEYQDSTEAFNENIHEDDAEEDYEEDAMNLEDSTVSSENVHSKESQASNEQTSEDNAESISITTDHEETTDGVLKFTDELPKEKKDDVSEDKKFSEPVEDTAHDYVDDNYEPDNYKERESSDSNNFSAEKDSKDTLSDAKIEESSEEKLETTIEPDKTVNEHTDSEEVLLETTTTPSSSTTTTTTTVAPTTTSATTTTTTTSTTTTTTTTTTTPAPTTTTSTTTTSTTTTTTARPTPPKLFKPISARKSYNYVPPTTTPNPVIIKPRLSLLNPKPAKPPKSYNELAPKPVIRKFSLLTRKPTTTIASTTITDEDSTEMTEIPTTIITTTTETGKSEENILESKLETVNESREREQLAPVRGDDQDSSPSEQKSPTNVKKEDEETFTPYPVARLSTLGFNIEKSLKEVEMSSTDAENTTTPRNFTLLDVEVVGTTADPVSSSLETSYPGEVFSTTAQSAITEEDRVQWTTKPSVDVPTEIPNVVPSTESTTILDTTIRAAEGTTTVRSLNKKMANQKKQDGFNCLEKEMYRFYGDNRDCRLFHYCSPGFTSRQVLDFRFVCEEGTAFDEASQSCLHDPRNSECLNRQW